MAEEKDETVERKVVERKKSGLRSLVLAGAAIATYTCGAMYAGDAIDVRRNYTTPIHDNIFNIETADDFAPHEALDLVTIVNAAGQRETFLKYDRHDGGFVQLTPIDDKGYADAGISDKISNYFRRNREALLNTKGMDRLERMSEKLSLGVQYYSMKIREWWDETF